MAGNYMESLVAYAAGYFPDFMGRLRGAEPQQIAALEQLVGRPLPEDYRQYLERMGGYGVSVTSDGPGSRAADVIAYYRDMRASGQKVPDGCIVIGPGDRVSSVGL